MGTDNQIVTFSFTNDDSKKSFSFLNKLDENYKNHIDCFKLKQKKMENFK